MELDLELYSHLNKAGVLEGGINNPAHKVMLDLRKVLVDKDTSILFENGIAFARYLIYIKRRLESQEDEQQSRKSYKIEEERLTQLRSSVTPSIRLHNWNIIVKELLKIGFKVNEDMKSLLVAGDYGIINDYLITLYNFEMTQTGQQHADLNQSLSKERTQENSYLSQIQGGQDGGQVDIGDMDTGKRPNETTTCLEFLLNVLCKAFNMTPKQAAGLLTNANKYLNIAVIKGLKGDFEPIVSLYQETYAHSKHLTQLIEHEHSFNLSTSTLNLILNAYKPGFLSQNEEVVSWCCRLFAKLAYDFVDAGEIIGVAWDWFKDENLGALETCIQALKKHQYILDSMIPVLINFGKYNFAELFTHHVRKFTPILADYFNLMHELIGPLNESKFSREELLHTGTLDFLIEMCISKGDTNQGAIDTSKSDREAALCLLCTIWSLFQEKFDKHIENFDFVGNSRARVFMHLRNTQTQEPQTLGQITLTVLKRACRDKSSLLRTTAISQLFRLLDQFSSERNQYAPILYKTLIFSLIENHSNELIRAHIMSNFQFTFERISSIPVGILVDPIVKQIYMTEGVTFKFNVFDFEFFASLARHPRLTIKNAIQIADLMAKAYLNEQALDFQNSASVGLMLIVTRFLDHIATQEFLIKFITVALTMLSQIDRSISEKNAERREKIQQFEAQLEQDKKKHRTTAVVPKKKWPPEQTLEEKLKPPEDTTEEMEQRAVSLIRRHRIIDIIKQLVKYRNKDLNEEMKVAILSALQKHIEQHEEESKGMIHLLNWWWGQPQKLLAEHIQKQKELEEKRQQERETQDLYSLDVERQYQLQYDLHRSEVDSQVSYPKQKEQVNAIATAKTINNASPRQKEAQAKQSQKSIMIKDTIPKQLNAGKKTNEKPPQTSQTSKPPQAKNEFLAIVEKSHKEEAKSIQAPKKKNMEPVRHKFDDVKSQQVQIKKGTQKTLHLDSDLDYDSPIPYTKHYGNSQLDQHKPHTSQPPYPKGYTSSTRNNLPPIPHSKSTKTIKKREDFYDEWRSSKNKRQESSLDGFSVGGGADEELQRLIRLQQQHMKNSKSQAVIDPEMRLMLQSMPYDNYLSSKQVKVAALNKRPKDRRVMMEIDKINQKKQEKEYKRYLEEQIKQFRDQRQKQKLRQALEQRKLELGISPAAQGKKKAQTRSQSRKQWRSDKDKLSVADEDEDTETERKMDVVILDEGERMPQAKLKLRKFMPPMQLLDINREEEERDRVQINLWLNKYNKLFKSLFNRYVNTVRANTEQNFDFKDQKAKSMNMGEILKFAKEHNIYPELLSKDEIQSLVRLLNLKQKKTEDIQGLDLDSFIQFFIQTAHNYYYCKENKIRMSVIDQMEELVKHMQKAMLYKGENVQIYADPEFVVGKDKYRLKQLNLELQEDPAMEVPLGFYKVYEKEQFFDYTLPEYLPIKESQKIASETLDTLMFDLFGIHLLEARAYTAVVPKIKQEQIITQGKHKKDIDEVKTIQKQTQQIQQQQRPKTQAQLQMSEHLKDQVLNLKPQYESLNLDDVGLTLEKMLRHVSGADSIIKDVKDSQPIFQDRIVNKIEQDRVRKLQEDQRAAQDREKRRLKHEQQLKERMSLLKEEKEGKDYDKQRKLKDSELTDFEKQKRKEQERQREFEQKKRALEEKKARDREEAQRAKEEEQERRRLEADEKHRMQKDFLKLQKGKIEKALETKIKDRNTLVEVQKQVEKEAEDKKVKIKSNMVDYLGKTKEDRKIQDEKQKEELNTFIDDQNTRNLFARYDKGLRQYYKYFAIQDKQTIEFSLEAKNDTINKGKFVKFGYQSNIYPALINHEDLLNIFRQVVRERLEVKHQSLMLKDKASAEDIEKMHVIDYEYFKRSLVMIAALAQTRLSSSSQPNVQNEQPRVQSRSMQRPGKDGKLETGSKFMDSASLNRKTKEVKEIKMLQEQAPKYGTKIEDIQVSKPLNMENMTPRILEQLFLFLDIHEGDSTTKVSDKIHRTRLEISGQRPTKLKKEDAKKLNI